jgi:hypothetical protein
VLREEEFGPSHLSRVGITVGAWFERIRSMSFTPYEIDEATGAVKPLRNHGLEDISSINLILLRGMNEPDETSPGAQLLGALR